ncbi:sugar ABC transporter ATP-binding protein [Streptomyces odontomachi]|uniref:sugar ABC transporter ATP-binding protein n=1 Tax=Streptomyces odontomachi TaxID=2944940 RepID=UPI00210D4491|nr:sugar ABC transporter ATP-binding protein [Streptomyces sp. ODS25]
MSAPSSRPSGPDRPQPAPAPVVRLTGARKEYGPVVALDDVDIDIRPAEVHCLAGENGAGKSTLIRVLSGAVARDGGGYEIAGRSMPRVLAPAEARLAGIGVVYQELSLLPELTVLDNLLMGHFPSRFGVVSRRAQRRRAEEMLGALGLADVPLDAPVSRLPTATRQLIEIARVIGADPRLVVFDEPTTALSEKEAAALLERIRHLRDRGTAVLYITHRLEEMFEIGDRVTVLRDGRSVGTHDFTDLDENGLIAAMVGREVTNLYPGQRRAPGPVRLEVRGLVPQGFPAPVDLTVRQGEIVGLAGLLGAGRTEILRAVFGAEPPVAGTVRVDGEKAVIRSPRDAVRRGIALLTEDRKESGLLPELSVRENTTLASLGDCAGAGIVSTRRQQLKADTATRDLRLKYGTWDDPVDSLSGGNQQKVLLGRWLGTDARVLLLDEPTKGVDIGAKSDIYRIIARLAEAGLAIVVVSSYLPELLGLCDRIVVVRERRVAGEITADEATEHRVLQLASPRREHVDDAALSRRPDPQEQP